MRYKIAVRTLQGTILTFHVNTYNITDGGFVNFTDEKTGEDRKFHASNTEIREVSP